MIYRRANSKYFYAAWYVKGQDGRLIKRSVSTKATDEAEALRIEAHLKAAVKDLAERRRFDTFIVGTVEKMTHETLARPELPLSLVWDTFAADRSQERRTDRTMSSKRSAWFRFLEWAGENHPDLKSIQDITKEVANEYLNSFTGKASSTSNNNKNSLSSVWKVLTIPQSLADNPWRAIAGAEDNSVSFRDFSVEEVRRIMGKAEGFWRYATAIGFFTGLRFTDVVHLSKSQIQGEYIVLVPRKTARKKKAVYIFVHPDLKRILTLAAAASPEGEDYLFPEAVADYSKKVFQAQFGKLLAACGVKDDARGGVGFHSLRHSFVTINEAAGVDRKVIQGIVGHGSPLMTGRYSHDMESCKILAKMPSLLEG